MSDGIAERLKRLERLMAEKSPGPPRKDDGNKATPIISTAEWRALKQQAEKEGVTVTIFVRQKLNLPIFKKCDRCHVLLPNTPSGRMNRRKFCDKCRLKDWEDRLDPEVRKKRWKERYKKRINKTIRIPVLSQNGVH